MNPARARFAESRPLPPFGRILHALIEALQLNDVDSYDGAAPPEETLRLLQIDGSTLRYCKGDLLKEANKRDILGAFAHAVGCLGWLPFKKGGSITETDWLAAYAAHYEHTSDRLAAISIEPEILRRCLARSLVIDLAIRAGAMDVIEGRHTASTAADAGVSWEDDAAARSWARAMHGQTKVSREKLAEQIKSSESPLDRVLAKKPVIPSPGFVRRFAAAVEATTGSSPLTAMRRHYAALALQRRLRAALVLDNVAVLDLVKSFRSIRSAVHDYALNRSTEKSDVEATFTRILENAGRHPDDHGFWVFLAKADVLPDWGNEFFAHRYGTWLEWVEQCHVPSAALQEWARGGLARVAHMIPVDVIPQVRRLINDAAHLEMGRDMAGVARKLEAAAALAPAWSGPWHSLGKLLAWDGDRSAAEQALRMAAKLDPSNTAITGDLANLLTYMDRADEAEALLREREFSPTHSPVLAWTWALIDTRCDRPAEAIQHAADAAFAGFRPGHSYALASLAARRLGDGKLAREYEKYAAELGWPTNEQALFGPPVDRHAASG